MLKVVIRILFLFFFLVVGSSVFAQQENDTIRIEFNEIVMTSDTIYHGTRDSLVILAKNKDRKIQQNIFLRDKKYYDKHPDKKAKIEESQYKFTEFLMEEIQNTKEIIPPGIFPSDEYFEGFEGKIIKEILYDQVQVMDGNVYDTTKTSTTTFGSFLNKSYAATKLRVLKNNIRFEKNDRINARILSDNERILTNLSYVQDAKIYVVPISNESDSVNILVVTKDRYPIGISGDIKDYNYFILEPYTRNFLGLGHRIGAIVQYDGDADRKMGYGLNYFADNVMGTFSSGEMAYFNSYDLEYFRTKLKKPFISTDTKLGGEIAFENIVTSRITTYYTPDSVYETEDDFQARIYDLWLGYSIFLRRDITKPFLNIAGRYYNEKYVKRPDIDPETNFSFHDINTILGAVSYQKVSYLETSKLLSFGIVEYVPVGFNVNVTAGWEKTTYYERPYAGLGLNYSILIPKAGIFAMLADVGGYYRNSKVEDFATRFKFIYFSPLLPVNRFELRNVFSFSFNNIINPLYHGKINFEKSVRGLEESELFGYGTMVMRYQSIFYTPYEFLGFNFSCKPFVDLGWISESNYFGGSKRFFSVYGLGLGVKNESLIFPAMNMYAGYYPNWTGDGSNFGFEIVFRDYKILNFFSELKPKTSWAFDFNY